MELSRSPKGHVFATSQNLHMLQGWGDGCTVHNIHNIGHLDKSASAYEYLQKNARKRFLKAWQGYKRHKIRQLQGKIGRKQSPKRQWLKISFQSGYIGVYRYMYRALLLLPFEIPRVVQVPKNLMILNAGRNGLSHQIKSLSKNTEQAQTNNDHRNRPRQFQKQRLTKKWLFLLEKDSGFLQFLYSFVTRLKPSLFLSFYPRWSIYSNGDYPLGIIPGNCSWELFHQNES